MHTTHERIHTICMNMRLIQGSQLHIKTVCLYCSLPRALRATRNVKNDEKTKPPPTQKKPKNILSRRRRHNRTQTLTHAKQTTQHTRHARSSHSTIYHSAVWGGVGAVRGVPLIRENPVLHHIFKGKARPPLSSHRTSSAAQRPPAPGSWGT